MLEKFQEMLQKFKKQKDEELMKFSLSTVQGFFDMQDLNKWLKFNAMNKQQVENAEKLDIKLNGILKKLYVPDYQSENI